MNSNTKLDLVLNQVAVRGPMHRMSSVARYMGIGRSTVYEMIDRGDLPAPIKLTSGIAVIPQSWLDAIVAARAAEPDAQT
jgi:predicted DNA-binding transcriptional regulator AlpA